MDKIGPKEAADTIREEFKNEHIDPRFHHQVRFAGEVLAELGESNNIENTAKVMRLLGKHGIEGHAYADFPKWVTNERGERAVVNDEDHEAAFMARPESHVDGEPNPEHGHVDPQSGVFHEGMKPVAYDYTEPMPVELVETEPEPFVAKPDLGAEKWKEEIKRAEDVSRADEIKAEQVRLEAAEKAAIAERVKMAELQKQEK
jgi:hypothetical protein